MAAGIDRVQRPTVIPCPVSETGTMPESGSGIHRVRKFRIMVIYDEEMVRDLMHNMPTIVLKEKINTHKTTHHT